MLFEMSEQVSVREVLKARGVVGHHVGLSWEEVAHMAVAMSTLVVASVAAEPGASTIAGDGTFGKAGQCWCVVGAGSNGRVGDWEGSRYDRSLP